jgi:hypothetical protein
LALATLPAATADAGSLTTTIDSGPIVIEPDSSIMPSGDAVIGLSMTTTIVPTTIAPPVMIVLPGGGF